MLRWILLALAVVLAGGVAAEGLARVYLGLGDPPLTIRDPEIEYLFAPSRCYGRFGNRVCYNEWSMRSPSGARFRLLVLGDSVVNGGALTDQADLASEIVARDLNEPVANISAGSWGPANIRAYLQRFGWFGAQSAVFVFSAQDLDDLPAFAEDLGPDFPLRTPPLALWEAVERYLPRYFAPRPPGGAARGDPDKRSKGEAIVADLLRLATGAVDRVCLAYHRTRDEAHPSPAEDTFRSLAAKAGVLFVPISEVPADYRDDIHLGKAGQRHLADVIERQCLQR